MKIPITANIQQPFNINKFELLLWTLDMNEIYFQVKWKTNCEMNRIKKTREEAIDTITSSLVVILS